MPLSKERLANKPLSGPELIEVVVADLREVLKRDPMFASYAGYRRVGYNIRITLHLANITYPKHEVKVDPRPHPEQVHIEGPGPLVEPPADLVVVDLERARKVESPNAARIVNGLPLKVSVVAGGRLEEKTLTYEPGIVPDGAVPEPVDTDRSTETTRLERARAGVK